jgi:hypothetical protein
MDTALKILFLVGYFGVPLYVVGRITWFLTSELESKTARRLWLTASLCATLALSIFWIIGGDDLKRFSRSLYEVLGGFLFLSLFFFVIDIFWRLLHWLTGEPYTPLVDELGAAPGGQVDYLDEIKRHQRDNDDDDLLTSPRYSTLPGNIFRVDSGLGTDHDSSSSLSSWDSRSKSFGDR